MKIELKPFVCFAPDYHCFDNYIDLLNGLLNVEYVFEEIGFSLDKRSYMAIFWLNGEEDKLFNCLFCNEKIHNELMNIYLENEEYEN